MKYARPGFSPRSRPAACPPGSTGPPPTTPRAWSMRPARSARFSVAHDRAGLADADARPAPGRGGRGGDRARRRPGSWTRCGRRDHRGGDHAPAGEDLRERHVASGRKTTASTRSCWPTCCARTGRGCGRWSPTARRPSRCGRCPRPQGPGRPAGRGLQPAARPPADPRSPARRACFTRWTPAVAGVPGPFRVPDAGRRPRRGGLAAWLATVRLPRRAPTRPQLLAAAALPRRGGATGEQGAASAQVTRALAGRAGQPRTPRSRPWKPRSPPSSPPTPTRTSSPRLPRSGTVRAARLLAEIGDCRARFPDPQALICLAGVAPVTRQSGKHKAVTFRWAVKQAAPRRGLRLRRRLPPRQPLGRPHLQRRPSPAAKTTPTRSASSPAPGCMSSGTAGSSIPYDPARHRALQRTLEQQQDPDGGTADGAGTDGDRRAHGRASRLHSRALPQRSRHRADHPARDLPPRPDFAACIREDTSFTDGTPMAWIDWDAAITALQAGNLPASSGERSILQLAASIANGNPVALRKTHRHPRQRQPPAPSPPSATRQEPTPANRQGNYLRPPPSPRRGPHPPQPKTQTALSAATWTQGNWHLLADPAARFTDLGPDWHERKTDRDRKIRTRLRQLQALGLDVTITPAA